MFSFPIIRLYFFLVKFELNPIRITFCNRMNVSVVVCFRQFPAGSCGTEPNREVPPRAWRLTSANVRYHMDVKP